MPIDPSAFTAAWVGLASANVSYSDASVVRFMSLALLGHKDIRRIRNRDCFIGRRVVYCLLVLVYCPLVQFDFTSAPARSKSAWGQTRTSADVCDTTASLPEADFGGSLRDVAEVP